MGPRRRGHRAIAVALLLVAAPAAAADAPVGTAFPDGFPAVQDDALGTPVIGFGAPRPVKRTPVVFIHGNNDTPYPTSCNSSYGFIHNFAQYFHERGYPLSDLWGLGWQGEQCDIMTNPPNRSGHAHTVAANMPDIRAFMSAFFEYTKAPRVDIVAHSLGAPLVREWMRQDNAYERVRRFVSVDGTNHGIINCSPSPLNFYSLPALGGFTPDSALCQEVGSDHTPLYLPLNAGDETPGPTEYLALYNADKSFVYIAAQDGPFPPVPEQDREGNPHSFARSALLDGATNVAMRNQEQYAAPGSGTAHVGIINSPEAWAIAYTFLVVDDPGPVVAPVTTRFTRRRAPRALTISTRVERLRRGVWVRTRGRLLGADGPIECSGSVTINVRAGRRTISSRRVGLQDDCRYGSSLILRRPPRRLRLTARFGGNPVFRPRSSRTISLSPGRRSQPRG